MNYFLSHKFLFPNDWNMPVWIGVIKEMKALMRVFPSPS